MTSTRKEARRNGIVSTLFGLALAGIIFSGWKFDPHGAPLHAGIRIVAVLAIAFLVGLGVWRLQSAREPRSARATTHRASATHTQHPRAA